MEPDQRHDDASYTRLRQLQTISEAALAHLRFDSLVDELLRRVTALLAADTATVLMLDEESGDLVATAAKGLEEEVERRVRVPFGKGFAGRVAAQRRAIAIHDVATADISNPILAARGLKSLLGAPLLVEGRVIGVLHVGSLVRREYTSDDMQMLQLAADRMAVAIDHSRLYEAERAAVEQLRRLESVTEVAFSHLTLEELLGVLLPRLRDLLGTDTAAVMLVDGEELRMRAAVGLDDWEGQDLTVKVGEGFAGRVAAAQRPLVVDSDQRSEVLAAALARSGVEALVGVPLVVAGVTIGVLTLGNWKPRRFTPGDVDLLARAGARIAVAIENANLYEAERTARGEAERAAERLRRVESISQVAFDHLSVDEEVLEHLLVRVLEVLGTDTAAVFEMDDQEQTLVARWSRATEGDVERGVRVPLGRGFAGLVAARRVPVRSSEAGDFELVSSLMRERGIVSLLGVPLLVDDRLLGVLHVGSREQREFSDEDVALLVLAGQRLAVALDHSRLYEREHAVAATLQRSLLPDHLPEVQGAALASRYVPGAPDVEVGGDWYDVIPLPSGRVGLAMGDVVSRGVRAASVMGQLRNSLRAFALDGRPPAQVLERMHGVLRTLEQREMATAVYLILDPQALTYSLASAGHPPPLVLTQRGHVDTIEDGRGPPLGAVPDVLYQEASGNLEPGSTLLLYTDGLVERREMWLDEGLSRLITEASACAGFDPEALLDRLLGALVPEGGADDDVAALAIRLTPLTRERLALRLPAEPPVLAGMRRTLRQWLETVGGTETEIYDVLVAVTEAAANAVEHAYGPVDASFDFEARSTLEGEVCVTVRDQGTWRPPRGHNRGRGTLLMQELMDHFEVTTSDAGTEVRMRRQMTVAGGALV